MLFFYRHNPRNAPKYLHLRLSNDQLKGHWFMILKRTFDAELRKYQGQMQALPTLQVQCVPIGSSMYTNYTLSMLKMYIHTAILKQKPILKKCQFPSHTRARGEISLQKLINARSRITAWAWYTCASIVWDSLTIRAMRIVRLRQSSASVYLTCDIYRMHGVTWAAS